MSGLYLGIDQSLLGTGVCLMGPRRLGHEAFTIKEAAVKKLRGGERLKYIHDRILTFLQEKTRGNFGLIAQAAMEGYAYGAIHGQGGSGGGGGQKQGNPFQLGEVGGVVKLLFEQNSIPYVVVNPLDLKGWVKGTRQGPKDVIMAYLTHEFGILFEDNNAADAYALACVAMDYAGDWHEDASTARIREGRVKAIQEVRVDPHAVLLKKSKDKIRQSQATEDE